MGAAAGMGGAEREGEEVKEKRKPNAPASFRSSMTNIIHRYSENYSLEESRG